MFLGLLNHPKKAPGMFIPSRLEVFRLEEILHID